MSSSQYLIAPPFLSYCINLNSVRFLLTKLLKTTNSVGKNWRIFKRRTGHAEKRALTIGTQHLILSNVTSSCLHKCLYAMRPAPHGTVLI